MASNAFNQPAAPTGLDMNLWVGIGQIITDREKGTRVRDAFKGGHADMVHLPAGTTLYKFNDRPSLQSADDERQNKPISPWWSPYDPYMHDPGWEAKKQMAKFMGVSVREWGRVTSAIKENWSSLMWLAVIKLQSRTSAAFGGFAHMERIQSGQKSKVDSGLGNQAGVVSEGRGMTANLPGGATQFYIHNLKAVNVSVKYEPLANL
jgi:hypothetical protein